MAYQQVSTRDSDDPNASADANQLQDNIDAILGTEAASGPATALEDKTTGPASAVDDNLATFDGTSGTLIKDSGSAIADLGDVSGPGSATDDNIVTFDGTGGKTIQDSGSGITLVTGALQKTDLDDTPADDAETAATSQYMYKRTFQGDYAIGGADPWEIEYNSTSVVNATATTGVWSNPTGHSVLLTPGTWVIYYHVTMEVRLSAAFGMTAKATMSTGTNNEIDKQYTAYTNTEAVIQKIQSIQRLLPPITVASNTTYYLNVSPWKGGGTYSFFRTRGDQAGTKIRAERIY